MLQEKISQQEKTIITEFIQGNISENELREQLNIKNKGGDRKEKKEKFKVEKAI